MCAFKDFEMQINYKLIYWIDFYLANQPFDVKNHDTFHRIERFIYPVKQELSKQIELVFFLFFYSCAKQSIHSSMILTAYSSESQESWSQSYLTSGQRQGTP